MTIAGEFYHVAGRINGMKREKQYQRFLQTATRLFKRRCEMLAYCLTPDQYDLLLLEHEDESIPALLVRLESAWPKKSRDTPAVLRDVIHLNPWKVMRL